MDNFRIMYKILRSLEKAMDSDEFDTNLISPEVLGISKNRRDSLLSMLVENSYIDGVYVARYQNESAPVVHLQTPRITIKGLEYLQENSMMQKCAAAAKGIADILA